MVLVFLRNPATCNGGSTNCINTDPLPGRNISCYHGGWGGWGWWGCVCGVGGGGGGGGGRICSNCDTQDATPHSLRGACLTPSEARRAPPSYQYYMYATLSFHTSASTSHNSAGYWQRLKNGESHFSKRCVNEARLQKPYDLPIKNLEDLRERYAEDWALARDQKPT